MLFDHDDRVAAPFPHAHRLDLFPPDEFEALRAEFPRDEFFHSRHDDYLSLRRGTADFERFLATSPSWSRFVAGVNSKAFFDQCLDVFRSDLADLGAAVAPDRYRFSSRGQSAYRTRVRSLGNAYHYVRRGIERSKPRRWINEFLGRDELYLQMTFNVAKPGYNKHVHRDRAHQVILMLIYFDDLVGCGGELELYRSTDRLPDRRVDRNRIDPAWVEHATTLPCRANSFVAMLNCPRSFHAVTAMAPDAPPRRFVGLTISKRYTRDAWRHPAVGAP